MAEVTTRDLRNSGGVVLDRVLAGERLTVTRSGRPVAELRPLSRRGPDPATLLGRWRHLPHLDPVALRKHIDEVIDPSL
ncbi:MAG: type II toxin-antitoxin system prevent-host-death family antitoxin [bacterium]|nr:type II toxin-antitoxin system prevent-host-death family antitoxin [Acidimicrobiia bacterium]MCY4650671.1 type II toxin-antitoxin system prevent-host-death family antitoxin [bacterium]